MNAPRTGGSTESPLDDVEFLARSEHRVGVLDALAEGARDRRGRFGDQVADLRFETGVVRYPAVSPAEFWAHMTTDSGPVLVALERVDADETAVLREAVVGALDGYCSDTDAAVALE